MPPRRQSNPSSVYRVVSYAATCPVQGCGIRLEGTHAEELESWLQDHTRRRHGETTHGG